MRKFLLIIFMALCSFYGYGADSLKHKKPQTTVETFVSDTALFYDTAEKVTKVFAGHIEVTVKSFIGYATFIAGDSINDIIVTSWYGESPGNRVYVFDDRKYALLEIRDDAFMLVMLNGTKIVMRKK